MALPFHALKQLKPYLNGEVLSLGYPDLMCSVREIESLFGYTPTKFTEAHKWHKTKDPMPETLELFEKIGVNLTIVDFTASMGVEEIVNLNYPEDLGKYDVVIDPGTLEHCFNIGQAFINAANAVKDGGVIMHLSPMTMVNHGFYNLCPTLFNDFYMQNGWEVKEIKILPAFPYRINTTGRFNTHMEYLIRCTAVKKADSTLNFPIQTKYLEKMEEKK